MVRTHKTFYPPVITFFLIWSILLSSLLLCKTTKNLKTQAVTKQELPKCQAEQNHLYQNDSLEKDINKRLSAKEDSLVDKVMSCPRIKLLNLRILVLDGVKTGVSRSDFTQQLHRKNADDPNLSFTLLDAAGISPTLALNQNTTAKERCSFSNTECQQLESLYTQGGGAYVSVRNLLKASNLPVSKVRQFLHS